MREEEKGELWFVARKKDLIVRGGSNISPVEVERVLMAHAAVSDAAVVGVPDAVLGQRVVGFVTLRKSAEGSALSDSPTSRFQKDSKSWTKSPRTRWARSTASR